MTTLARAGAILAASALLASCSTAQTAPAPSSATASATATSTTLTALLAATQAEGSAMVTVEVFTTVDDVDDAISGSGVVALDTELGEVAWTSAAGDSVERLTPDGAFIQLEPPDGPWRRAPQGTATSDALAPLSGLGQLQNVRSDGTEELATGPAERYIGSLPAAQHIGGFGLNPMVAEAVEADATAAIDVALWVDSDQRITRIMRTLRTAVPVAAATFTELTQFGTPVDVSTPEAYDTAM